MCYNMSGRSKFIVRLIRVPKDGLDKMLTHIIFSTKLNRIILLSFVLGMFCSVPSLAGNWQVSYSNDGTYNYSFLNAYSTYADISGLVVTNASTGSGPWPQQVNVNSSNEISIGYISESSYPSDYSFSGSVSGTVTATLTWVPDDKIVSVNGSDPPPAYVALVEAPYAAYDAGNIFGSVSDGRGDPVLDDGYGYSSSRNGNSSLYYPGVASVVVVVSASSGTITRQCSMSIAVLDGFTSFDLGSLECTFSVLPYGRPLATRANLIVASDSENDLSWGRVYSGQATQYFSSPSSIGTHYYETGPVTYNVYRSTDNTAPLPWSLVGSSPSTTYQNAGLQPNTQYFYYVTAVDQYGDESSPSNIVTSTTDALTVTSSVVSTGGSSESGDTSAQTASQQLATANSAEPQATPPPSSNVNPYYLSGTNAVLTSWASITGTGPLRIVKMVQKVNGKVFNTATYPLGVASASVKSSFDTTYYSSNTPIVMQTTTYTNSGITKTTSQTSVAYNQACVYGNVSGFKNGTPIQTAASNTYVALETRMNHTATLSSSANKSTILSSIPANTVFYIATHASHFSFSDCTGSKADADSLFTTSDPTGNAPDITTVVGQKSTASKPYPRYNFVFVDGCSSAQYPDFAYAFGVTSVNGTLDDNAFLGWNVNVDNTPQLANWTTLLWNSLALGMTLSDAVGTATSRYPLGLNQRGQPQIPVILGDYLMKLHGLYRSKGLTPYYKALP